MNARVLSKNRLGWLTVTVLAVQGLSSCALPPREAWQRMKEEGVLRALFVPHKADPVSTERLASSSVAPRQPVGLASGTPTTGARLPTAEAFAGHRGFVYSPFTRPKKLVNATGFAPGEHALCPYTMNAFIVPDYGQGAAVASRTASPRMGPEKPEKRPESKSNPSNPAVVELVSRDLSSPIPTTWPASPPYGTWVPGRAGYLYSPFAATHQLVDVTGIAAGVEVKCPYTGKLFRVPEPPEVTAPVPVPTLPEAADPAPEKPAAAPTDPSTKPAPASTPQPTPTPTPASPTAVPGAPAAPPQPSPVEEVLPTADWVEGKPGLVQSPFGTPGQLVDVTGREPGAEVICPFSNKAFLVPAKK